MFHPFGHSPLRAAAFEDDVPCRLPTLLISVVLVLDACVPGFGDLPPDARVACRSGADCPPDHVCAAGRCTAAATLDTTPPAFGSAVIPDPPRGKAGTVFRVRFEPDQALGKDPEVVAQLGQPPARRTVSFTREASPQGYVYAWTAWSDGPDGTASVTISLQDVFGNRADLPGGAFVLDLVPPAVLAGSARVSPDFARAGAVVVAEFDAAEDLDAASVRVGEAEATQTSAEGGHRRFEFVVPADAAEGPTPVSAHLHDPAGNVADSSLGTVVVDRTAPQVDGTPPSAQRPLRAGEEVRAALAFTEPVGDGAEAMAVRLENTADPSRSVDLERLAVSSERWSPRWDFVHTVREGEDGAWQVVLHGVSDRAGNMLEGASVGVVAIDTLAPAMSAGPVLERDGWFREGDVVRVLFAPDEEVSPDVRLGAGSAGVAMEREAPVPGFTHVYSHRVTAADPPGDAVAVVLLADAAGNVAGPWRVTGAAVDCAAPVAPSLSLDPGLLVPARASLVVTATADEMLGSARLESVPPLVFGPPVLSGTQAIWSRFVLPSDAGGEYVFTVHVSDRAGNESALAAAQVRLDTSAPRATDAHVEGSPAKEGAAISVVFDVTEDLAQPPSVTIGNAAAEAQEASARHFAFAHAVAASEGPGARDVVVRLRDPAGNETETLLGRVVYDFAPPRLSVADVTVTPSPPVGVGADLRVVLASDEPLAAATLDASPSLDFGAAIVSGDRAVWSRIVTDSDAGGPHALAVALIDLAGNRASIEIADAVVLDTSRPGIANVQVAGSPAREGAVVSVSFDVSEDLRADPSVSAGAVVLERDAEDSTARHHVYRHTAAKADGAGTKSVTIAVADPAGNSTAVPAGQVVFDFDAPVAGDVVVTPASPVGLGANLTVRVTASEPLETATLAATPALELGEALIAGRTAVWSRIVSESDAGESYSFSFVFTDPAGNRTLLDVPVATRLDTTRPVVSGVQVAGSPARKGTPVSVEFDVSEDLRADPSVSAGVVLQRDAAQSTARHHVYRHVAAKADGSGTKSVTIAVTDAAGNTTAAPAGQVVFDFDPPLLTADDVAVAPKSPVGLGANLTVRATANEPLAGARLAASGLDMGNALISGSSALWTHLVAETDTGGSYALAVTVADLAGNETEVALAPVVLDTSAPELLDARVEGSPAREGAQISVFLSVSEALPSPPSVTVGAVAMQRDEAQSSGDQHVFVHAAAKAEHSGAKPVVATLADEAGNTTRATIGTATYDFDPPVVDPEAVTLTPASPVGIGANIALAVTADEPLGAATLAATPPTFDPGAAILSGKTALWYHAVAPGESGGTWQLRVTVQDLAGNEAEIDVPETLSVDAAPPGVHEGATLEGSPAAEGAVVTARFETTEPLRADPDVRIDGVAMEKDPRSSGNAYVYTHEASAAELSGAKSVVARLVDAAGNATPATLGEVVYDFDPPSLALADVAAAPDPAGIGKVLTVQARANEALSGAEIEVLAGGIAFGPASVAGRYATWTHAVAEDELAVATSVDASIVVRDLAGNASDALEIDGLAIVDPVAPKVLDDPAPAVTSAPLKDGATLEVRFTASEALAADPRVTVGGVVLVRSQASAPPAWVFTHAVDGSTEPEGTQPVLVSITDAAGNRGAASVGAATYDFTPPSVAAASVGYAADPANPLGVVTAATAGTHVVVFVQASEALDSAVPPQLHLLCGSVSLTQSSDAGTFDVVIPESTPDGVCTSAVSWRDLAGNAVDAGFSSPPVRVKTSRPVLHVDDETVTFVRSPWGSAAAENLGSFTIPAGPYFALAPPEPLENTAILAPGTFTLASGAPVRLRFWADPSSVSLVGIAAPNADGSWPRTRLANLDVPCVYASALDEAGNESAPVRIARSEWVATPNPAAIATSPHVLQVLQSAVPSRLPDPVTTTLAGAGAEGPGGASLLARAEATWRLRAPAAAPPSRSGYAMAYDSIRGRVVVFGGTGAGTTLADTWEWDGLSWSQRNPAVSPPARAWGAMVFDSARGRSVLFGGSPPNTFLGDTWEWDGTIWSQRASTGPAPRQRHAMAWDSVRRRVVLFGGRGASGMSADTWEWDGAAWSLREPGPGPGARTDHVMAYDAASGRTVLFGGTISTIAYPCDTWEWDGAAWTRRETATTPRAHFAKGLAWDVSRGRLVLTGGEGMSDGDGYDWVEMRTWEFDGTDWTVAADAAPAGSTAVYDSGAARTTMILVGSTPRIWTWDGAGWTSATPGGAPSARSGHALAWDDFRKRLVLFGGFAGTTAMGDTWEWDGVLWTRRTPAASPSPRGWHAMAWDSVRHKTVLFGGTDYTTTFGETWEWDGTNWAKRTPASSPSGRVGHAMAYDPRGRAVMFGGDPWLVDLWEWDGTNWTRITPLDGWRPDGRGGHAMAYDPVLGRVLLFGGYENYDSTTYDDTWVWDGMRWTVLSPSTRPPPLTGHAMAADPVRRRVVLSAGDTWEWDGSTWTRRTPAAAPDGWGPMAWDGASGRVALAGGSGLWLYDAAAARRPAFQFGASAAGTGFAPADVSGLRVRARCGGAFSPYPASAGAALLGWAAGGAARAAGSWVSLRSNAAGIGSPALLDWSAPDADEARQYMTERDRAMAFQCRSAGASGADPASVAMDYFEVRVRYVLP